MLSLRASGHADRWRDAPGRVDSRSTPTTPDPRVPAGTCGIEQEFFVFRGDQRLDAREFIHDLGVPGVRRDPGDRNAYRLSDGSVITADGRELEFATVPVFTVPGFAPGLCALSAQLGRALHGLLPRDIALRGAATHINVGVPPGRVDEVVLRYTASFGAALQALWDKPWGEGVMIRPRAGRIEFGGEFLAGPRLAAVALFCVASVEALLNGAENLPRVRARPQPCLERLGIQWRPWSFSEQLYTEGRRTRLRLRDGRALRFDRYLASCWRECRKAAAVHSTPHELSVLDRIVSGKLPLGIESGTLPLLGENHSLRPAFVATPLGRHSLRDGTSIQARFETWQHVVFSCAGERDWFLCVPRPAMRQFRKELESGDLGPIPELAARPLTHRDQLSSLAAFSRIPDISLLVPLERAPGSGFRRFSHSATEGSTPAASWLQPQTAGPTSATTTRVRGERLGKWVVPPPPEPPRVEPPVPFVAISRGGLPLWAILLIVLVVLTGIGIGIAVALGGEDAPPASGTASSPTTNAGIAAPEGSPSPSPAAQVTTQPSPTSGAGIAATASPTPTTALAPAVTPIVTASPTTQASVPTVAPTEAPLPTITPTPQPPTVITTQVNFRQIISAVTGSCGASPPAVGTDLSLKEPSVVVLDRVNHTIKIGDSLVSPYDPATGFAAVTWGTGDKRRSDVVISPSGISGTSSFYPYWNIPQGATCFVTLQTTATVAPGFPPFVL